MICDIYIQDITSPWYIFSSFAQFCYFHFNWPVVFEEENEMTPLIKSSHRYGNCEIHFLYGVYKIITQSKMINKTIYLIRSLSLFCQDLVFPDWSISVAKFHSDNSNNRCHPLQVIKFSTLHWLIDEHLLDATWPKQPSGKKATLGKCGYIPFRPECKVKYWKRIYIYQLLKKLNLNCKIVKNPKIVMT